MTSKDRKKLRSMLQQQQEARRYPDSTSDHRPVRAFSIGVERYRISNQFQDATFDPTAAWAASSAQRHRSQPNISLEEFCIEIFHLLTSYTGILTIQQLLEVDRRLCEQQGVPHFSAFNYDDVDDDDEPPNLISFLDKHRQTIDPHDELSVYQETASTNDRDEVFAFIRQLSIITDDQLHRNESQRSVTARNGDLRGEQLHLSAEKASAIGKAVTHRFGGWAGYRNVNSMVQRAVDSRGTHDPSVIR